MPSIIEIAKPRIDNARTGFEYLRPIFYDKFVKKLTDSGLLAALQNVNVENKATNYLSLRFAKYPIAGWSLTKVDITAVPLPEGSDSDLYELEAQTVVLYKMALYGLLSGLMNECSEYHRINETAYADFAIRLSENSALPAGVDGFLLMQETRKGRVTEYVFYENGNMNYTSVRPPVTNVNGLAGLEIAAEFMFDSNFDVIESSMVHYVNDVKFTVDLYNKWLDYDDWTSHFDDPKTYKASSMDSGFRLTEKKKMLSQQTVERFFKMVSLNDIDLNNMDDDDLLNLSIAFPSKQ